MKWLLGGVLVLALMLAGATAYVVGPERVLSRITGESATGQEAGSDTVRPPTTAAKKYIRTVTTVTDPVEGLTYKVRPTKQGRLATGDEIDIAWEQAVARGVPDRASLRHQFHCHPLSVIARAKPTWDLEVFRPNVGLTQTMLAGCNPM